MAIEANGNILVANQSSAGLVRLNPLTGEQSHVTDLVGYGADVITVAVEADGSVLFGGRS
jgi:streptogramin lyase